MIRLATLLSLLVLSGTASALQTFDVADGHTVAARVSVKEYSRIALDGQEILSVNADAAAIELQRDTKDRQGHFFVRPRGEPARPATVFVTTARGTYAVLCLPTDAPAETILLRDRATRTAPKLTQSTARVRAAKTLIVSMARDEVPEQSQVREEGREHVLWQEARLVLERSFLGPAFVGERWSLANVSREPMIVREPELHRPGIVAIAIERQNLAPGESTPVFMVRERRDDE